MPVRPERARIAERLEQGERLLEPLAELLPTHDRDLGVGGVVRVEEVDGREAEVRSASLELVGKIRAAHRVRPVDDVVGVEDPRADQLLVDPAVDRDLRLRVWGEVPNLRGHEHLVPGELALLGEVSDRSTEAALGTLVAVVERGVQDVDTSGGEADRSGLGYGDVGRPIRRARCTCRARAS